METQSIQFQISEYASLLRRGKYLLIVPAIISVILGSAVAFKLPPVYRSDVRLFYIQAQIPEWLQLQAVNMYLESMLMFIEALTFSPQNMITWINDFNLYPDLNGQVPMADIMEKLRTDYRKELIYTTVPGSGGRTQEIVTGFSFSFDHEDPDKAFQVANELATKFIVSYRQFRENFAMETTSFFEDERIRLKAEITEIDSKISAFKEKNVYELPELMQSNYRMVDMLRQELSSLDQEVQMLRTQQRSLESRLATTNPYIALEGISGQPIVTPEEKLAALKSELGLLISTYSERHPDVIRTRHEIEKLEQQVARRTPDNSTAHPASGEERLHQFDLTKFDGAYNPVYIQLLSQIDELQIEIDSLKQERREREKEIQEYERRVARTPMVEKEYLGLQRELESAQQRYNELVNQVLKLESAAAMEKREIGDKLTIGQPPSFPLRPAKPNRPLIIAGSFMGGIMIGVLLLLAWDQMSKTVRTSYELAAVANVPVYCELPLIMENPHHAKRLWQKNALRFFAVLIIILTLVFIDIFYMKVDVLLVKVIDAIRNKFILSGL